MCRLRSPTAFPAPRPPSGRSNLGLNDGLAALRDGSVDALFWSGGVPTAAIAAANRRRGLGFLDLSAVLPAMRNRYGAYYDRVLIPEEAYRTLRPSGRSEWRTCSCAGTTWTGPR